MHSISALLLVSLLPTLCYAAAPVLTQPLTTWRDLFYAVPATIGTPPQQFRLVIDEQSYGLTVAEKCCVACCHMNAYEPTKSTSYSQAHAPMQQKCYLDDSSTASKCYPYTELIQVSTGCPTLKACF